jgi:hypothetical protein
VSLSIIRSAALFALADGSHWSRCVCIDVGAEGAIILSGEDKVLAASPAAEKAATDVPVMRAEVTRLEAVVDTLDTEIADAATTEERRKAAKAERAAALLALDGDGKGKREGGNQGARKALSYAQDNLPKLVWNDEAARPRLFNVATADSQESAELAATQARDFFDVDDDSPSATDRYNALGEDARALVERIAYLIGTHSPRGAYVGTRAEWEKPAERRARKPRRNREADREAFRAQTYATLAKIIPPAMLETAVSGMLAQWDSQNPK